VLEHDSPRGLHWDFMLEQGNALRTWALAARPDSPGAIAAEALADHRLAYLDNEGPVSGDRGTVTRWDRGDYEIERCSEVELVVILQGKRLAGRATLARLPDLPGWEYRFVLV
jgi:hypothetical protein